jgi:hypothetical protein
VAVREACPGLSTLVEERMHIGETVLACDARAFTPGSGNSGHLRLGQLRERAGVPRRRDDDLVVVEDRVEVRHHPDRPTRRVGVAAVRPDRERLGRRPVLAALAERAGEELLLGREVDVGARRGAGSPSPVGRDDDPLPRDGVLPELPRTRAAHPPLLCFSMNGVIRSIGAGKTIVVD